MDPALLSTADVAAACTLETRNYLHRLAHDNRFCFELFRRALHIDNSEALNALFLNYRTLILGWVLRHDLFVQADEDPDFLASHAFWNFYFAVRGEKFLGFPGVPHLLKYLAACVHSVVESYARQRRLISQTEYTLDTFVFDEKPDAEVERQQFWQRIKALLPDPSDRLLIRLRFIDGLPPREIVTRFPQLWPDERTVTVHLQRVLARLYKDSDLRDYVSKITRKRS